MLARIRSAAIVGIDAVECEVEVDVGKGSNPNHDTIVGLPDASVKESIDRVRSAITNSGYTFPDMSSVINLAPAEIKKEGPSFDLPIAIAILTGQGVIDSGHVRNTVVLGELALDGRIRPIKGALATAVMASANKLTRLILPAENASEAAVVSDIDIIGVETLTQAIGCLNGQLPIEPTTVDLEQVFATAALYHVDFADVRGQEDAKRAMTIAAAGNHNLLMIGPPGAGKTMLTKRLPTILPPLTLEESLETTKVHSALGLLKPNQPLLATRPVRTPHHSASGPSLVGGGSVPKPGEISLAHHGLLFLDEFPEFSRTVLETIRQPLEDGSVTIARSAGTLTFPANIMLVAAMNPCPCGRRYKDNGKCKCSTAQIEKYMNRISGPLVDRIDMHIEIPPVPYEKLADKTNGTSSADIRKLVLNARKLQNIRFADEPVYTNSRMDSRQIRKYCQLDDPCRELLKQAVYELGLSARAHDKVLKVARTIADIENCHAIQPEHIAEAIHYRKLDRQL